ncbi:DinB family protein [Hymenobacter arizonensis]|uniref:DinB superfamily protein n=1 Tax=Hymenobacter arizonensis TaxID=1227077 RepID=A0A1I5X9A1_HYMAR|nr:DinB family protein [Hymenobacter arizonensis]SFQ28559.1 DinB superfamily protein [Hymenobacter arizonensis]
MRKKSNAITSTAFLAQLDQNLRQLLSTVQTELAPLELAQLNHKPAPTAWSILECLEHLNRYSRYYNPRFAQALAHARPSAEAEVRYSWVGRKFIEMIAPTNPKKAKAFGYMNPSGSQLDRETLTEFCAHQQQLLALLAQARHTDLNRKAVPVEFLKLLKLRLGETFELQVLHEQRHVQQALRVKAGLSDANRPETTDAAPSLLVASL